MAAWTTGKSRRRLFNSPAKGGADSGVRSADRSAADPVPGRAATSGDGLKENLESRRKRGAWTAAEDAELSAYVAKFGAGDWKHVADATALKRDAQSCRLRWSSYLNPKVNRAPFTPEEDALLLASVAWGSHGETKWAGIASAKFPSRTGYQIQSRWHSLVNKQRRGGSGRNSGPSFGFPDGERSSAGGNTTVATDAPPVAAPPGRSSGNTSLVTVAPPPAAARRQPARKTAATDALAVVTGGITVHATCPVTPGTTASGAISGAMSGVASGDIPGFSSGVYSGGSSGVLPCVAPNAAASIAATDSTDPSAVAAFILALQSAISGLPRSAGSGKYSEPSTPARSSVAAAAAAAAATPSTTAAFIQALQSTINGSLQTPSSSTTRHLPTLYADPSTHTRASLAATAAAPTPATSSTVAAFIQALESAINGRDQPSSSTPTLPYPTTHVKTPSRHSTTLPKATQPNSTVSTRVSMRLLGSTLDFTTGSKRPHTALLPPTTALLPPTTTLPRPSTAPATASPAAALELPLFPVTPQSSNSKSDSDAQASGLSLALSLQPPTHAFNTQASATVAPMRLYRVNAPQSILQEADILVRSDSGNGWITKRAYSEAFEPEAAEGDTAEPHAADVAQDMLKTMGLQGSQQGMVQEGMAQHVSGTVWEHSVVTLGCDDRIVK
ncbi:unnamed protein product [Closterium sp. NIES-54]